jgi:hypothetical protein
MTFADIRKWISGENDALVDHRQTQPPSVSADSNPGEEMSTARPSRRKFEYIGIAAAVGVFASIALTCFVLAMQYPVDLSPTVNRVSQPTDGHQTSASATAAEDADRSMPPIPTPPVTTFPTPPPITMPATETSPTRAMPMPNEPPIAPSDAQPARPLREAGIGHDRVAEGVPGPDRKPPPSQRVSRRHWPRHSVRAQAERGEAARLMADELRQRGIAPVSSVRGARRDRQPWRAMRQGESLD